MSTEIQETIDRLRELDRTASPAPWKFAVIHLTDEDSCSHLEEANGRYILDDWGTSQLSYEDADLIAETRNAIPELIAEIERLTTENKELKRENHLAWSKGHAAGWDCHIVTMQSADLLPKDQKTSPEKGA